ncbi:MAG: DUF4783 domain-containing protein [Bacteroidetes bacterium]|nr:DUF4783 domain-containing protein [Bacteroidota bacterium]
MKHYLGLITLSVILSLCSFTALRTGNNTGMEMEDVVSALKSGNATSLSRYFDSRIDLTLPTKSDNYSRTQAEMILRDFFYNNTVRNFEIKYKGDNNGARYCVGMLKTKSGDYRTRLFMKLKGDKQVVQEIAFQPEE